MGLTKQVLRRPVTTVLVVLCLIVFGLSSVFSSKLELTPEMEMPMLVINAVYPGASPEDVEELVKYAEKYPKPASPVIYYISSQSLPAYVKQLPVEGTFGTGITDNGNDTFTISHNIWKNVAVFETYRGEPLDRVAMVGTDSPDRSTTLVRYPAGSTRIEAVAWDGTRTLVYGSR